MGNILNLNKAFMFHQGEINIIVHTSLDTLTEEEFNNIGPDFPLEPMIDPQTMSNHYAMLSWILSLVAQKHTTSFTFYVNKCKELSIPHYTEE